ncbi:MAG: glycosyltransferase family 4 protein [Acidobacteria bacterium]|nr:glycosyltransferase family 4 protein [Acidobacteriota bacterium]
MILSSQQNEVNCRQPNCRFVGAGNDNTIDKKLSTRIRVAQWFYSMEANFIPLPSLDQFITRPLLAASDIFVSPSHSESFGPAILDAMIAGCPVVAAMTGGAIEPSSPTPRP